MLLLKINTPYLPLQTTEVENEATTSNGAFEVYQKGLLCNSFPLRWAHNVYLIIFMHVSLLGIYAFLKWTSNLFHVLQIY